MNAAGPSRSSDPIDRSARLLRLLRASADPSGFVPFDRFMDLALYAEDLGFYTRRPSPLGAAGDFYTAAHASPLFGRAVAERVVEVLAGRPSDAPLSVVELGPGDGTLAEAVAVRLAAAPGLASRVELVLVDRSERRAMQSYDRVSRAAGDSGLSLKVAASIAAVGPFDGVVLANEVLDAQPTRRLEWTGTSWRELGVRLAENEVVAASTDEQRGVPGLALPGALPAGCVVEVSPAAEALVREVADHLTGGRAIFIDFGLDERELLAAHPHGTLAVVRGHREVHDPLDDPGNSDLSMFVNFRRIRAAARAAGLTESLFERQAEALGRWGFPKLLDEALRATNSPADEVRFRLAAKNLLFGFENFWVLELAPPT